MAAMETISYGRIDVPSQEKHAGDDSLPPFDASEHTSTTSIIAIGSGTAFSLVCIIVSIVSFVKNPIGHLAELKYRRVVLRSTSFEAFSLLINLALTFVTDSLSFVHSVSLRWALADEGRLEFNTSIRLLTSSWRSGPNKWWVNTISLGTLMLCYGATSVLFVSSIEDTSVEPSATITNDVCVCCRGMCTNMVALVSLGIGLAVQTAVAAWCLLASRRTDTHGQTAIPTWSTNPLNATLTALHRGLISHRDGRCMLSAHRRDAPVDGGVFPSSRQDFVRSVHRAVRYVVFFLWGLAVAAVAWPIIIALLDERYYGGPRFSWMPDNWSAVVLAMSPAENIGQGNRAQTAGAYFSFPAELVLGVLFVTTIQALQTAGLHFIELLVNLSRDEAAWRQATSKRGATYLSEPFWAAATSWENWVLFIAKSVLHWFIGQSLFAQVGTVVTKAGDKKGAMFIIMSWSRLTVYAICAIFMAAFATYLALRKPRGTQPAAWGHLQTLADLVDDWTTNKDGRFWWGDKTGLLAAPGETDVVRHAGMRDERVKLKAISMDCAYAGMGEDSESRD